MTAIVTTCRDCGIEFQPDHAAIIAGTWRICLTCRPQASEETHCERCGRLLRAGRILCLSCAGGNPL